MEEMQLNRRAFLGVASRLGALGLFAAAAPAAVMPASRAPATAVTDRLASSLRERESAAALGCEILRLGIVDGSAEALIEDLLGQSAARLAEEPADRLRGLALERHRRDCAEDEHVELHGWVLSRAEARLCALVALAGTGAAGGRGGPA